MNTDFYLARMDRLTEDYLLDAEKQARSRKPTELFGLKFGPSDDPLHERYLQDMAALLHDFAAGEPDSTELRAMLEKLFAAAQDNPEPVSAHWMLVAVQGLSRELIPRLSSTDAAALAKNYEKTWPRRARMPVQDEVLKLLKRAGK